MTKPVLSKNPVVRYIVNRIRNNRDCNIVITGATGGGKSYAGARLGWEVSQELGTMFCNDDNIAFTVPDLMKLTELSGNQGIGSVFMLEEAGAKGDRKSVV